jgi:pyridoxal phosphate enzyme (YggS family)
LANELQKKLYAKNMKLDCLMQINSAKEDSKHGFMPELAKQSYEQIQNKCPNINLKGVMSIGTHSKDTDLIKNSFKITYDIFKSLDGASICSMGMSSDFELAIECGSNMVRLGSVMFNK